MAGAFQIYLTSHLTGAVMRVEGDAETGAMRVAQTVALAGQTLALTCAPDGRHIHVAALAGPDKRSDPLYATLAIDPADGALSHRATVPAPAYMAHVSMDRSGRWLLGASEPSGRVSVTAVGEDGLPEPTARQVMTGLDRPHHILTDRGNRWACVPCMGEDAVRCFALDAPTGRLAPQGAPTPFPAGGGPRHMAHHPSLDVAWLVTQHDGAVTTCAIDRETGALTALERHAMLDGASGGRLRGAQIRTAPDGGRLFASERSAAAIISWRIDPVTGRLSNRRVTTCPTGVRCFDIDPGGRFLVVGGVNSDRARAPGDTPDIACFPIDPATGALGSPQVLACMDGVYWVEIARPGGAARRPTRRAAGC